MEGSVAAAGATGADGGTGEGAQDATPGAVDLAPLTQTLEGVQASQEELRGIVSGLAQQLTTSDGGDGEGDDGLTAEDLDLGFLEDGQLEPAQVAERLQGLVDQRAQQIATQLVDQRLGPLEQRVNDSERTRALQDLVDDVPEMGDPRVAQQVTDTTKAMAEAYGWPAEVATDPRMYRIVYMAARAAEIANSEGDGTDGGVATLEGGGGARPAGAAAERDLGNEIVDARKGRGALPFG